MRSYFFKGMKMLNIKKKKYIIKIIFSCEILFFQGYENVNYQKKKKKKNIIKIIFSYEILVLQEYKNINYRNKTLLKSSYHVRAQFFKCIRMVLNIL